MQEDRLRRLASECIISINNDLKFFEPYCKHYKHIFESKYIITTTSEFMAYVIFLPF